MKRRRTPVARETAPGEQLPAVGAALPEAATAGRRYLTLDMRPMTLADMVPGHPYEPGMTILSVMAAPSRTEPGPFFDFPLSVPEKLRKPTPENACLIFSEIYERDLRARLIIDHMKQLAKPWPVAAPVVGEDTQVAGKQNPPPRTASVRDAVAAPEDQATPHVASIKFRQ